MYGWTDSRSWIKQEATIFRLEGESRVRCNKQDLFYASRSQTFLQNTTLTQECLTKFSIHIFQIQDRQKHKSVVESKWDNCAAPPWTKDTHHIKVNTQTQYNPSRYLLTETQKHLISHCATQICPSNRISIQAGTRGSLLRSDQQSHIHCWHGKFRRHTQYWYKKRMTVFFAKNCLS